MENNKNKKSDNFQGDMLIFQVFVFTTNHHFEVNLSKFNGNEDNGSLDISFLVKKFHISKS